MPLQLWLVTWPALHCLLTDSTPVSCFGLSRCVPQLQLQLQALHLAVAHVSGPGAKVSLPCQGAVWPGHGAAMPGPAEPSGSAALHCPYCLACCSAHRIHVPGLAGLPTTLDASSSTSTAALARLLWVHQGATLTLLQPRWPLPRAAAVVQTAAASRPAACAAVCECTGVCCLPVWERAPNC